jgi:hypothetical protein
MLTETKVKATLAFLGKFRVGFTSSLKKKVKNKLKKKALFFRG